MGSGPNGTIHNPFMEVLLTPGIPRRGEGGGDLWPRFFKTGPRPVEAHARFREEEYVSLSLIQVFFKEEVTI